jgi:hypothetical protein
MMGEAAQDDNDGEEAQEEGQRRRAGYGVREARVQGKNGTERLSGTRKLSPFSEQGMEQRKCRHPWIAIGRHPLSTTLLLHLNPYCSLFSLSLPKLYQP